VRLLIAAPLMAALIGIDAPLDLLGIFQHIVAEGVDPGRFIPLFAWARFIEGGGNLVLALAAAGLAIALGARQRPPATSRIAPVAYEAASLSNQAIASATSEGRPGRPIGVITPRRCARSGCPPLA